MTTFPRATAVLEAGVSARVFPGAVVEIGRRSGPIGTVARGALTYDHGGSAVTPETVYDLASLTKVLATAALIAQAIESGRMRLNDRVRHFIPAWTGDDRQSVTLRDLLEHCSGLPAHRRYWETRTGRASFELAICEEPLEYMPRMRRLAGIVSERDLFALQRLGLGEITTELRVAADIAALTRVAAEIRKLTLLLVGQGVAPEQLTLFVSVLNDRLSQRVIEIVRKQFDLERVSWCWLSFGSEGRFEQTLSTDQDNGLLFVAHDGAAADHTRSRLLPFARAVNEALDACGFPLCKGNVMASNPELCLSLEEWKAKMAGWIEAALPKALLDAAICFDFRPLYGDAPLAAGLREWVSARVKTQPAFLRHMAQAALAARPGLTRFGGFAGGDASGALNLKLQGARIFIDAARIYALALGVTQTNTAERLRAVRDARTLSEPDVAAALDAFYLLQRLRLQAQALLPEGAREAANRIVPADLGRLDQTCLKEAMRIARDLQKRLSLDYQL